MAWFMLALGVLIVGTVLGYVKFAPADRIPDAELRPEARMPLQSPAAKEGREVRVLDPKYVDGDLSYESSTLKLSPGEDRFSATVNAFLKKAGITPAKAVVKTAKLTNGALVLDFSPEFEQTYGTEDEKTLVDGILTSIGQFKEVETVEFRVNGRPLETLGNLDLSMPLPVIRPK